MKRSDNVALIAAALVAGYIYSQQDPKCDRGCRNNWEHLMELILPVLLQQWGLQA